MTDGETGQGTLCGWVQRLPDPLPAALWGGQYQQAGPRRKCSKLGFPVTRPGPSVSLPTGWVCPRGQLRTKVVASPSLLCSGVLPSLQWPAGKCKPRLRRPPCIVPGAPPGPSLRFARHLFADLCHLLSLQRPLADGGALPSQGVGAGQHDPPLQHTPWGPSLGCGSVFLAAAPPHLF